MLAGDVPDLAVCPDDNELLVKPPDSILETSVGRDRHGESAMLGNGPDRAGAAYGSQIAIDPQTWNIWFAALDVRRARAVTRVANADWLVLHFTTPFGA